MAIFTRARLPEHRDAAFRREGSRPVAGCRSGPQYGNQVTAAHAALAEHGPDAVLVEFGQVDDSRRQPVQLTTINRQVNRFAYLGHYPGKTGWRRLPAQIGTRLKQRVAHACQRARNHPHPEPGWILPTGKRIPMPRIGDDQCHRTGQEPCKSLADPLAEITDQFPHRKRRQIHDGGWLAVVAPLDLMDPGDCLLVQWIAGQSVDAIGRKQGDATLADAALESLPGGISVTQFSGDNLHRAIMSGRSCLPATRDHPLQPGEVRMDSRLTESGSAHKRRNLLALSVADLEGDHRCFNT